MTAMTPEEYTAWTLNHGLEFPYMEISQEDLVKKDWAVKAVFGILADLTDRRGVKQELNNVDEDVRGEMVESLAAIIRLAKSKYK